MTANSVCGDNGRRGPHRRRTVENDGNGGDTDDAGKLLFDKGLCDELGSGGGEVSLVNRTPGVGQLFVCLGDEAVCVWHNACIGVCVFGRVQICHLAELYTVRICGVERDGTEAEVEVLFTRYRRTSDPLALTETEIEILHLPFWLEVSLCVFGCV